MPKNTGGGDSEEAVRFELSKNRFATVSEFKGKVRVDIREFYMTDEGERKPGKKGISLSMDEWKKLTSQVDDIEKKIKEIGGGTITSDSDSSN